VIGQFVDIVVFNRLRHKDWWRAPFAAGLAGSTVDTAIFFPLAFSAAFIWLEPGNDVSWATFSVPLLGFGPQVPLWASLAVADWGVKVLVDLFALMPFRAAIARYAPRTA
jgi:queuosine precursor transporter